MAWHIIWPKAVELPMVIRRLAFLSSSFFVLNVAAMLICRCAFAKRYRLLPPTYAEHNEAPAKSCHTKQVFASEWTKKFREILESEAKWKALCGAWAINLPGSWIQPKKNYIPRCGFSLGLGLPEAPTLELPGELAISLRGLAFIIRRFALFFVVCAQRSGQNGERAVRSGAARNH